LANHPTYRAICRPLALSYYWTACESEYLSRWLVEETIRFIKQSYRLEDL
jgi:hypothetical protein